jgi:hypothetical protein
LQLGSCHRKLGCFLSAVGEAEHPEVPLIEDLGEGLLLLARNDTETEVAISTPIGDRDGQRVGRAVPDRDVVHVSGLGASGCDDE